MTLCGLTHTWPSMAHISPREIYFSALYTLLNVKRFLGLTHIAPRETYFFGTIRIARYEHCSA